MKYTIEDLNLVQTLRDHLTSGYFTGICMVLRELAVYDHINYREHNRLYDILHLELPRKSQFYREGSLNSAYIWEIGDKKPRLEFLDSLIDKIKNSLSI